MNRTQEELRGSEGQVTIWALKLIDPPHKASEGAVHLVQTRRS